MILKDSVKGDSKRPVKGQKKQDPKCTGGEIEVGVPRKLIGMYAKDTIGFDFKWCDNPDGLDDIITICTTGDTAPNRRFNYRFLWGA